MRTTFTGDNGWWVMVLETVLCLTPHCSCAVALKRRYSWVVGRACVDVVITHPLLPLTLSAPRLGILSWRCNHSPKNRIHSCFPGYIWLVHFDIDLIFYHVTKFMSSCYYYYAYYYFIFNLFHVLFVNAEQHSGVKLGHTGKHNTV